MYHPSLHPRPPPPPPVPSSCSSLGLAPNRGAMAKYRDLYLERGLDILSVESAVWHFLWPRWGLEYGAEVLEILDDPRFKGRPLLVHAFSIGGTNVLCDPVAMEAAIYFWRKRGIAVETRKWKESVHAAHLRCHPEEYLLTLETFLNSLKVAPPRAKM
ncbi:unnamed protein product [Coregonus sp. 'balchen']|nr:unnamed protein product [Coregonus sp. 'balchen']